jgi:uncharacterized protein
VGTIINAIGIIVGSLMGLQFKKIMTIHLEKTLMNVMGVTLLVFSIGWFLSDFMVVENGLFHTHKELFIIVTMVIGALIGYGLNLDARFKTLIHRIETKHQLPPLAHGFIVATLIFNVGAIAILGPIEEALSGDMTLLMIKTILDFVTSMILAATLGIGVMFSFVIVMLYQGLIMAIAWMFGPFMSEHLLLNFSLIGNLLLVFLALDFLKIKEIKLLNLLPALFIPVLYELVVSWL